MIDDKIFFIVKMKTLKIKNWLHNQDSNLEPSD